MATSSLPVEEGEQGVEEPVDDGEVGVVETDRSGRDEQVRHHEQCIEGVEEDVVDPVNIIIEEAVLDDIFVNKTPIQNCHGDGNGA